MTANLAVRHGQLVTQARQALHMSQVNLATAAGCAQQTISRIEKGEQVATARMVIFQDGRVFCLATIEWFFPAGVPDTYAALVAELNKAMSAIGFSAD